MTCSNCGHKFDDTLTRCPTCLYWNINGFNPGIKNGTDGTVTLDKVKSAKLDKLDAGPFSHCWSGGIVRTSATLIGGYPGAGKTTMLLQLSDSLAKQTKKEIIYIAAEQDASEIKLYADRLKLKFMHMIRILPAMSGEVESIPAILNHYKPGGMILDSLQGFVGDDDARSVEVCKIMKNFAVSLKAPAILISHVTKGDDFAGLMTLQHAVDTLMTLNPDEETGIRILEVVKNRFGRAYIQSEFEMTEHGLDLLADEGDEGEDE